MTKKTRIILFSILLLLFCLTIPAVILYSKGYRINFENWEITQTGAFYFKVWPKNVEIYIQERLKAKTDFFFGTAFIKDLLPKKYKIEIKKEGYFPWKKTLEIKEKQVTEAKDVVLFPENLRFEPLDKNIENFFFSPDGKKIILQSGEEWTLKLLDLEKDIKTMIIEEKDLGRKGTDILNLEFSEDSKEIYLDVKIEEKTKNFLLNIEEIPPVLEERKTPPLAETKKEISFNKNRFLIEDNVLYQFNPETQSFEKFFEPLKEIKISPDRRKLVYFSDYEIWIFYWGGDKVFLLRFSEKIRGLFWLNSHYLIMQVGNKIKIAEIDNRDRINIHNLAEFPNFQIFWSKYNKKIYLLSEGNFLVSERILP